MDTILKYLDMSFKQLPNTPELFRLKEEMAANMEEKYNELKSEGKTENEAVGIVITEFGNIEEIANELNISFEKLENEEDIIVEVSEEEAREYIETNRKASINIAIGIMLCIIGVMAVVGISVFASNEVGELTGILGLLFFVAIGVGFFIYGSYSIKPWEFIEKGDFKISLKLSNHIKREQDFGRSKLAINTIIAVFMYIISVGFVIGFVALEETGKYIKDFSIVGVIILLFIVGIATMILTISYSKNSAYNALLKKEDYSKESKRSSSIIGAIAAIWWPVTTGIFFYISFLTSLGFKMSWIVWPISGVIFGGVVSVVSVLSKKE